MSPTRYFNLYKIGSIPDLVLLFDSPYSMHVHPVLFWPSLTQAISTLLLVTYFTSRSSPGSEAKTKKCVFRMQDILMQDIRMWKWDSVRIWKWIRVIRLLFGGGCSLTKAGNKSHVSLRAIGQLPLLPSPCTQSKSTREQSNFWRVLFGKTHIIFLSDPIRPPPNPDRPVPVQGRLSWIPHYEFLSVSRNTY